MKILVLENDAKLMSGLEFTSWVKDKQAEGHEVEIIYNAYNNAERIIQKINWPDLLAFTTTFVYIEAIYNLALAIGKYRKEPLNIWIDALDVADNVNYMVSKYSQVPVWDNEKNEIDYWENDPVKEEEFGNMMKHLTISQFLYDSFDKKETLEQVTVLSDLAARYQAKIDTDNAFKESRKEANAQTGRMIKIRPGILRSAPGKEWSELKPGMVVPEISMDGASERVSGKMLERGVWVMGLTEPVKLLNDSGHDEFEIVTTIMDDLADECIRKCGAKVTTGNMFLVLGILKDEEMNAHLKATWICDELGAERRHNRSIIEERIKNFEEKVSTVK